MKIFKRFVAAILAMVMVFSVTVMAQDATPREVMQQADANIADVTTMNMRGNVSAVGYLDGEQILRLEMGMDMSIDVDLETETFLMYIRMPISIAGEGMAENIEVALFMDGEDVFVYIGGLGWALTPSEDASDFNMNMEELTQWALDFEELFYGMFPPEFAAAQPEGYYVIEMFMAMDDLLNFINMFITPELFGDMTDELFALLDDFDLNFEMISRSYIDRETVTLQRMTVEAAASMDLDLGILGTLEVLVYVTGYFDIDYNPQIAWPEIDVVIDEPDAEEIEAEHLVLLLDDKNPEERFALFLESDLNFGVIDFMGHAERNLNVFFVNHGINDVRVSFMNLDSSINIFSNVIIAPGSDFTMQIPVEYLAGPHNIVEIVTEGSLNVEIGFRLTNVPLS